MASKKKKAKCDTFASRAAVRAEEEDRQMKLYDLPRRPDVPIKIYEKVSDGSTFLWYHHVDGMYSYCESEKGGILHLSVGTPLVPYKDGYKINELPD